MYTGELACPIRVADIHSIREYQVEVIMKRNLIWVASYPKSGNTWVRTILQSAITGSVNLTQLGDFIPSFPFCVSRLNRGKSIAHPSQASQYWPHAQTAISMDAEGSSAIIKTHNVCAAFGGASFPSPEVTQSAIYIVRDPRDVAISYSYHFDHDLSDAIELLMDENNFLFKAHDFFRGEFTASWQAHVNSWMKASFPVLLIRYEDLLSEPETIIEKIITFLEIDPKVPVNKIADATSFRNLSHLEQKNGFSEKAHSVDFFRVGQAHQWTQDDSSFKPLVEAYSETLVELGYEIT
jgi:hypothetical protein